jgi:sugar phosphate isomerase/epimerase
MFTATGIFPEASLSSGIIMTDFRFGCSSWFFQELSIAEALQTIEGSSFSAAEIWMEHLWKSSESPGDLRILAKDLGLSLSLHAASYDVNIASTNPGIRKESLRQIEESLRVAGELGARPVVVHAGRLSSSKGDLHEYWRLLVDAFDHLQHAAVENGAEVAIEVMEKRPKERFVGPEDVHRLMVGDHCNMGLTVDLAHIRTVMDHREFFSRIPSKWIIHAHLSDSAPGATHVPLGRGSLDIDGALRALHSYYRGVVIVEGYVPGEGLKTIRHNRDYLQEHGWM